MVITMKVKRLLSTLFGRRALGEAYWQNSQTEGEAELFTAAMLTQTRC